MMQKEQAKTELSTRSHTGRQQGQWCNMVGQCGIATSRFWRCYGSAPYGGTRVKASTSKSGNGSRNGTGVFDGERRGASRVFGGGLAQTFPIGYSNAISLAARNSDSIVASQTRRRFHLE